MKKSTIETIYKMDWWCTQCGGEGEIPFPGGPNHDQPTYVVCSHCSHPSAYGWCEKCGVGTQLEWVDIRKKPKFWECDNCKTEYRFPVFFYENPLIFYPDAFSDVQKIKEIQFIREYGHITITWLKSAILFWDKYRIVPLIFSIVSLILAMIWDRNFTPLSPHLGLIVFSLVTLFFLVFLVDIITWLISKVFLALYRNKKKKGRQ